MLIRLAIDSVSRGDTPSEVCAVSLPRAFVAAQHLGYILAPAAEAGLWVGRLDCGGGVQVCLVILLDVS